MIKIFAGDLDRARCIHERCCPTSFPMWDGVLEKEDSFSIHSWRRSRRRVECLEITMRNSSFKLALNIPFITPGAYIIYVPKRAAIARNDCGCRRTTRYEVEKENWVDFGDRDAVKINNNFVTLTGSVHAKSILREDSSLSKDNSANQHQSNVQIRPSNHSCHSKRLKIIGDDPRILVWAIHG